MGEQDALESVLASVTPERLTMAVAAVNARLPEITRGSLPLRAVLGELAGDLNIDTGPDGWYAQLELSRVVQEVAEVTPGVRYVQGDS